MTMEKRLIYILRYQGTNLRKVGISKDPKKRITELESHPPRALVQLMYELKLPQLDLRLEKTFAVPHESVEHEIHRELYSYKARSEWYTIDLETTILIIEHVIRGANLKYIKNAYQPCIPTTCPP